MLVKELIEKLKKYDENMIVANYDARFDTYNDLKEIDLFKMTKITEKSAYFDGDYEIDNEKGTLALVI